MSETDVEMTAVVRKRTDSLLGDVGQCVELLPELLDEYGRAPEAFDDTVSTLRERESVCNATARELRLSVGQSVTPASTGLYLMAGDLVSLYTLIEAIANRAETVGTELAAIRPTLPESCRGALVGLAERAIVAIEALSAATRAYVDVLVANGDPSAVVEPIERVRSIESDCDEYRQAALRVAFEDGPSLDALALRTVVYNLDGVVNGIETAADRLDVMRATRL
jgi:hypothetical protein